MKCGLQGIAAYVQWRMVVSHTSAASRKRLKHPGAGFIVIAVSEAREVLQIGHMLGAFSRFALLYESVGIVTDFKMNLKI